ncbi:hypothetical protein TrRE_jg371, partial [Triparma retinervis]
QNGVQNQHQQGSSAQQAHQQGSQQGRQAADTHNSDMDLLSDIFSAPPIPPNPNMGGPPAPPVVGGDILDMFGGGGAPNSQPLVPPTSQVPQPAPTTAGQAGNLPSDATDMFAPRPAAANSQGAAVGAFGKNGQPGADVITAYSKDCLTVDFVCTEDAGGTAVVTAVFKNSGTADMTGLNFQVAVPKYIQMSIMPPSSTTVPTGGGGKEVTQVIRAKNGMRGEKKMMMKLKISYTINGNKITDMATANNFPTGY